MALRRGHHVLLPGELLRYKYKFYPKEEGTYTVNNFIECIGWPDSRIQISVHGICDMPRLDTRPKKMFPNFVRRSEEDEIYHFVYLDDQKIFHCGYYFISPHRVYEEITSIKIHNVSLIPAEVKFSLEQHDEDCFRLGQNVLKLEPGCEEFLTLKVAPKSESAANTLVCHIVNNSELVYIPLICRGVLPIVEVLPLNKSLDFGKLLLYRNGKQKFIIKNDSVLPVLWCLQNKLSLGEEFDISHESGVISRDSNQVITITYKARKVEIIQNRIFNILIYDEKGRGEPLLQEEMGLSAECYDVAVECSFEDLEDYGLNYGSVKINSNITKSMFLLNRGKYNIFFKIRKIKGFPEPKLLRGISITPSKGLLPPNLNMVPVEFACTPESQVALRDVPAFICMLLDGSNTQIIVAEFPICITIASFYNTFTIHPLGMLNFGVLPLGVAATKIVMITNTSPCPVTYEIEIPEHYRVPASDFSVKQSRSTFWTSSEIKCGHFTITDTDNLLPPGTNRKLKITFFASEPKSYSEEIKFIINDTCPAEASGVPFKMIGTGVSPTLDFWNIEATFRGHMIVKSISDYKLPEGIPHCVFVENTAALHFFCLPIFKEHTAVIDLYNNSLVPNAIQVFVQPQTNTGRDIFTTDKVDVHIQPLEHASLGVIFAPKALEEYRAVLEVKLKIMQNIWQSYKICLVGEGVLPRISMLKPRFEQKKAVIMKFPTTFVGETAENKISMICISPVQTRVIIEIEQNLNSFCFKTGAAEEIGVQKIDKILQPQLSNETFDVIFSFSPLSVLCYRCQITINIVDNPFEQYVITAEAESYSDDVVLNDLKLLPFDYEIEIPKIKPRGDTKSEVDVNHSMSFQDLGSDARRSKTIEMKNKSSSLARTIHDVAAFDLPLKYKLYLGGLAVNKMHQRNIVMTNHSRKLYKFEWNDQENVKMVPDVGYISPGQQRDVIVNFYSRNQQEFKDLVLVCSLSVLAENHAVETKGCIWDSRQVVTTFRELSGTNIVVRSEKMPSRSNSCYFEFSKETKSLYLVLSATVEYSIYDTDLEDEINFGKTLMYKKKDFSFNVVNLTQVVLNIAWDFSIEYLYPQKNPSDDKSSQISGSPKDPVDEVSQYSVTTLFSVESESTDTFFDRELPFSISPKQCSLSFGSRQTFTVTFAPLTSFNYNAQLRSTIENLHPRLEEITVNVKGMCTIPFCHFDIEESDYLSSGRRNLALPSLPVDIDYTVIEFDVLDSGCFKKVIKLMNPSREKYSFAFELYSPKSELVPVHFEPMSGEIEAGSHKNITITFTPTTSTAVFESEWLFKIYERKTTANLLIVGLVRDPNVTFSPTILLLDDVLIGNCTSKKFLLCNNEDEPLEFKFKGSSISDEVGRNPVRVTPSKGTLMPQSQLPILLEYTPLTTGEIFFKASFQIEHLKEFLWLGVKAKSEHINPQVTYYLQLQEHMLREDADTNIHFDETASHYKRQLRFTLNNNGTIPFEYCWESKSECVKKYMEIWFEPTSGVVEVGKEEETFLNLIVHGIPVVGFPFQLVIKDGPTYSVFLHAEIEEPIFRFSFMEFDFGLCFVDAPDFEYKKNILFRNNDTLSVTLNLNFNPQPELLVDINRKWVIMPSAINRIPVYFRPKAVKKYEFKLPFYINTLCERIVTIKGEGIPLLFDLDEGCSKKLDFGAVVLGRKVVREALIVNHSRIPITGTLSFVECDKKHGDGLDDDDQASECLTPTEGFYKTSKEVSRVKQLKKFQQNVTKTSYETDLNNSLKALSMEPQEMTIQPGEKKPIKITFHPVGLIENIKMQYIPHYDLYEDVSTTSIDKKADKIGSSLTDWK